MKTQISVQVQNENWISRCMSLYGTLGLFTKSKVSMYIDSADGTPTVLKARKEPYLIDIEPGAHVVAFTAKNKAAFDKVIGGMTLGAVGAGMGMASNVGGIFGATAGAQAGADFASGLMGHCRIQESILECALQEGDKLAVQVKPKRNGSVNIKLLSGAPA